MSALTAWNEVQVARFRASSGCFHAVLSGAERVVAGGIQSKSGARDEKMITFDYIGILHVIKWRQEAGGRFPYIPPHLKVFGCGVGGQPSVGGAGCLCASIHRCWASGRGKARKDEGRQGQDRITASPQRHRGHKERTQRTAFSLLSFK
jgi:hypothetical protein